MAGEHSLEEWRDQFADAAESVGTIISQVKKLEALAKDLAKEVAGFESRALNVRTDPEVVILTEILDGLMGETTSELKKEFISAQTETSGDITDKMLSNLTRLVGSTLVPTVDYDGRTVLMELEADCDIAFGEVEEWFKIVETVRITKANNPTARMIGWMKIFDAGVLKRTPSKKGKKRSKWNNKSDLSDMYNSIISARYAELGNSAPYWYFLEHGNMEFVGGSLYPYPAYGAPGAVSTVEERIIKKGNKLIKKASSTELKVQEGYEARIELLEDITNLIEELYDQLENDEGELAKVAATVKRVTTNRINKQLAVYRSQESLQDLSKKDLQTLRDTVLSNISDKNKFKIDRLYLPSLGKAVRIKALSAKMKIYLVDLGIDDVGI